jgi:diguanylate cyclase (GGDEF)-like protein
MPRDGEVLSMPPELFPLDPLTGLPGRAFLRQRLAEEWDRATSLQQPLAVLAMDLDDFRKVNSRYGHLTGDAVLAAVARLILSHARPGDLVIRDGGDQFTVILPATDSDEAFREAERLRLAIASHPIRTHFANVAATVSVGVATLAPLETDPWALFVRARNGVHRAKDSGGNRAAQI